MKRWLFLIALLPQCTGCMGYVYPTMIYTPEVVVPNADSSAHAFRVDIDKTERKAAPVASEYTLTRIALDTRGVVPSQLEIAPVSGIYNPFALGDFKEREHSDYTIMVRLYRPGFQTITVKAWDKSRTLQWSQAPDLVAQERAIDDLLADPAEPANSAKLWAREGPAGGPATGAPTGPGPKTWWDLKDQKSPPLGLQPGAISPSQKQTLLFAATEYQRLASSPVAGSLNMQPLRERLQQKAIWLRIHAEQTPVP